MTEKETQIRNFLHDWHWDYFNTDTFLVRFWLKGWTIEETKAVSAKIQELGSIWCLSERMERQLRESMPAHLRKG